MADIQPIHAHAAQQVNVRSGIDPQYTQAPPPKVTDRRGYVRRFLTVIGYAGMQGTAHRWWCVCECGNIKSYFGNAIIGTGTTASCGCKRGVLVAESRTSHGHASGGKLSKTYRSWTAMRIRCTHPGTNGYHNYGGRGITICAQWKTFAGFLADMGEAPSEKHTIDRIDVNGNYEPDNCRWVTQEVQDTNKRTTRYLTINGRTQCVSQWSRELGISSVTLLARLKDGWSVERALTEPVNNSKRNGKAKPRLSTQTSEWKP